MNWSHITNRRLPMALLAGLTVLGTAAAAENGSNSATNLAELSLEELINLRVTSVSKKETSLYHSPAAISVIVPEDIRRSGATSVPEALRLVPGLEVAQINSSQWAISSRGFNNQFANKLLVLIDGRSVYTPGFGGVVWELQDVMLEDLDRIEVIRGPGATLWGANAVNGVINITSKSAKETQGVAFSAAYGTELRPLTGVRYGGQAASNLYFRVYGQYANHEGFADAAGNQQPDDRNLVLGGARFDWEPGDNDRFTLQGDYFRGDFGATVQSPDLASPPLFTTNFTGENPKNRHGVLGRWTHDFSSTSQLTLQTYYDHSVDTDASIKSTLDLYDIDLQHRFALGSRQDIVWGAGFRYTPDDNPPSFDLTFTPQKSYDKVYSAFIQDDVTVVEDRLHVIVGSKFEHNPDTEFEFQPSGRLLWTPTDRQTVWAAISRAVRTPSRFDLDSRFNQSAFPAPPPSPPILVSLFGNPGFKSEELLAYELGYRIQPVAQLTFDLAGFYNVYDNLRIFANGTPFFEPTPAPHVVIPQVAINGSSGETYGAELSAQWQVTDHWRLSASYSWLEVHLTQDTTTAGDSPEHQFQIHSDLDVLRNLALNAGLYYVSELPNQKVQSYVRADLGLIWRPGKSWEIGLYGQNLFDNGHTEFGSFRTPTLTEVPRSVFGRISWNF